MSKIFLLNYWMLKSEPGAYSWEQFWSDKTTVWSGIRNYAARLNLRAMKTGDRCLFYHSNIGLQVVGIAEVIREAYPDPTADTDTWSAVDLRAVQAFKKPVPLSVMKETPSLKNLELIRISRLSVSKVSKAEYETLLKMGGLPVK